MAADGSIIFDVSLDDKQAHQELKRLNKKIQNINDNIYKKQQERMPLVEQAKELGAQLDSAKAKLDSMQSGSEFYTISEIKRQEETIKFTQKEWGGINRKIESCDSYIQKQNVDLDLQKEKYGEIEQRLVSASNGSEYMADAVDRAGKYMEKFTNRIKGLARRVFVFTLITAALRSLRTWLGKAIKTNSEATAAIARLKGALLTLAQPLINVIIPAFTEFVNVLSKIVSAAASVMSALFGTTVEQSAQAAENLYDEQQAIEGVGSSAKKASKQLASFDEINKIGDDSGISGGSYSGSATPDFKGVVENGIMGVVGLFTGIALVALGAILTFTGAHVLLGLGIMAAGTAMVWTAAKENPEIAKEMVARSLDTVMKLVGAYIAIIGVVLLFCTGNLGLGLAMLVAGAAIFAIGSAAGDDGDFSNNIKRRLLQVAEFIGPLIAVIGVLLAVTGHIIIGISMIVAGYGIWAVSEISDDNGMTLQQKITEVLGRIAVDIGAMLAIIGVILMLLGQIPKGAALLIAGISLFAAGEVALNWDLLKTDLVAALSNILGAIGPFIAILGFILLFVPGMLALGIGMLVAGIALFAVSKIAPNWNFILEKIKEAWNGVKSFWKEHIAKYFTAEWWNQLGRDFINGFLEAIEGGINTALSGLGDFVNGISGMINKIPGVNIDRVNWGNVKLPRLATGAVIPPNREFLAVLGDQKQGTNIEAPLETLVQAFKIAAQEMGGGSGGDTTIIMEVDGQRFAKLVYNANKKESGRVGVRLVEV